MFNLNDLTNVSSLHLTSLLQMWDWDKMQLYWSHLLILLFSSPWKSKFYWLVVLKTLPKLTIGEILWQAKNSELWLIHLVMLTSGVLLHIVPLFKPPSRPFMLWKLPVKGKMNFPTVCIYVKRWWMEAAEMLLRFSYFTWRRLGQAQRLLAKLKIHTKIQKNYWKTNS